MRINLPTILTIARTILAPLVIVVFYLDTPHRYILAAFLFWLAGITDFLDGYLARKLKETSNFGAFLDPIADKILVAGMMVMLVEYYRAWWILIPAVIIIYREIMVSGLREWMAKRGEDKKVQVALLGKIKTAFQMGAIFGLILVPELPWLKTTAIIFMWIATALTVVSMGLYFYDARRAFDEHE